MAILETKRLYLRKMQREDYSALCEILQDKEVMYAYEHPFDENEVKEWLIKQCERYERDGFGLWAVIRKSDSQMIGQCGPTLQECDGIQVVEVGYLFKKACWKEGYAIEAADACKNYAFEYLGCEEVYSIIRENNLSSMRVAIRNGMMPRKRVIKHYYGMDMPHIVFSIRKEERTEPIELTTLCMIYHGDEILVQNRTDEKFSGLCFPGGHVKRGEPIVESIKREVKEETGLLIEYPKFCGIKQFPTETGSRYLVLFFKTDKYDGKVRGSEEGEVFWIKRSDIPKWELVEDFMDMLQIMEEEYLELYYSKEEGEWKKNIW